MYEVSLKYRVGNIFISVPVATGLGMSGSVDEG